MKNITIITGASSGLGKEFTKQIYAKYNFDEIWIIARRTEKLQEVANSLTAKTSTKIRPITMDLSGTAGVSAFKNFLQQETSNNKIEISLLINNAGFGTYGPFTETPISREMEMIDLNCTTLTGICGVCIPFMPKGSLIINTASLAGFMPLGNFAVYSASKAYALNFSVALAAELKDKGIKVCAFCPGSVRTEFANVASNGARKELKGSQDPEKVVAHCLKKAYKGKKITVWYPKWKFNAFLSHIVGKYAVARFTFKFHKRPRNPD